MSLVTPQTSQWIKKNLRSSTIVSTKAEKLHSIIHEIGLEEGSYDAGYKHSLLTQSDSVVNSLVTLW